MFLEMAMDLIWSARLSGAGTVGGGRRGGGGGCWWEVGEVEKWRTGVYLCALMVTVVAEEVVVVLLVVVVVVVKYGDVVMRVAEKMLLVCV